VGDEMAPCARLARDVRRADDVRVVIELHRQPLRLQFGNQRFEIGIERSIDAPVLRDAVTVLAKGAAAEVFAPNCARGDLLVAEELRVDG
jgi:hypothetical protein